VIGAGVSRLTSATCLAEAGLTAAIQAAERGGWRWARQGRDLGLSGWPRRWVRWWGRYLCRRLDDRGGFRYRRGRSRRDGIRRRAWRCLPRQRWWSASGPDWRHGHGSHAWIPSWRGCWSRSCAPDLPLVILAAPAPA